MAKSEEPIVTEYAVQAFTRDRKGLQPGDVAAARDAEHACRMARRIAQIRAGAVAFARRVDRQTEEVSSTRVLELAGETPDNLDELMMH